jgi:hypothetical protein
MNPNYIVQTRHGPKYTELFSLASQAAPYTKFMAAVAYATVGGVHELDRLMRGLHGKSWDDLDKRWLVGIDWCRSDPAALARLVDLPKSQVRVPNGKVLIQRENCTPSDTYHPKLFILQSQETDAIICGSGNLSANGLRRGCECGNIFVHHTGGPAEPENETTDLLKWFRTTWERADPYAAIRSAYESTCKTRARTRSLAPTDDDLQPPESPTSGQKRGLTEQQIRQLRIFDNFWIEAGALGANLGRGVPGNQLDMKRFTRAFFGAPIEDVPPNTIIDEVTLLWRGNKFAGRTLKFGDNAMDKLNVPPAGNRGLTYYRDKTLLFTRLPDGSFRFTVGSARQKQDWKARSSKRGILAKVGPREWGLF